MKKYFTNEYVCVAICFISTVIFIFGVCFTAADIGTIIDHISCWITDLIFYCFPKLKTIPPSNTNIFLLMLGILFVFTLFDLAVAAVGIIIYRVIKRKERNLCEKY